MNKTEQSLRREKVARAVSDKAPGAGFAAGHCDSNTPTHTSVFVTEQVCTRRDASRTSGARVHTGR